MLKKTPRFIFAFVLGLIIFLPSFFILPKLSFAAVSLTASSLNATSVTLNAKGLEQDVNVKLGIISSNSTPSYGKYYIVTVSTSGTASATFTGLSPGGQYTGDIAYPNVSSSAATVDFTTLTNSTVPTVISVFPTAGIVGSTVTIDGANFSGIEGVLFGSVDVGMNFTAVSSTRITAVVPPVATDGKITVRTTNGNAVSADTFVVTQAGNLAPQIISFYPVSGKAGDTITITGYNLTGVNQVLFNTTPAVTRTNSLTEITVGLPVGATNGKITIQTTNGSASSAIDFTVAGTATSGGSGSSNNNNSSSSNVGGSGGNVEFHGLVPVCNTKVNSTTGTFDNPCDFNMLMAIINKVINFLLITLATPLFALILIYVGWLYLSAGGSSENVTQAKKIFKNVVIGYVIALAAWLIVKTILTTLGFTGPMFLS